jgi:hypothetical protein
MDTLRAVVYRWLTAIWPATLFGVVLGAVLGLAATLIVGTSTTTATALVRLDEPVDPNAIMSNTPASPESQQLYLSGEITYLSSPGFADAVAAELQRDDRPSIAATQRGQSAVVDIAATAADADSAKGEVDAALKVYSAHTLQINRERVQTAIDAINAVMMRTRAEAADLAAASEVPVDQAWLDQRLVDLDRQQLALRTQLQRSAALQVIEPAVVEVNPGSVDPKLAVIGGGLIGGLLALALALGWRNRTGIVVSDDDVKDQGVRVLTPTFGFENLSRQQQVRVGRQLYSQLSAGLPGLVLVVGASATSGSEVVARLIHQAAAEHTPAETVSVADAFGGMSRDKVHTAVAELIGEDTASSLIIDGGSVSASGQLVDVVDVVGTILVVARIGHDVRDDVAVAVQLASTSSAAVAAVCTR